MKLSALTKAILNDNARMETSSAALSLAGGRTSPPGSRRSSLAQTRHRSGLGASTSSATEDRGSEGDGVKDRATKRHSRTGSGHAQQPTSSRLSSPVRSRENSPAPRKRIVRLSATTNGGAAAAQNPLRRSLSTSTASQRSRRPANSQKNEEQPVSQALSQPLLPSQQPARQAVGLESADLSTPAQPVRTVRIAVGSSGGNRARSMGSSSGVSLSSKPSANGVHSDHDQPEEPGTAARAAATMGQASVTRQGVMVGKKEEGGPQSSMRVKRVGKLAGSFLSGPARRGRRRQSEEEGDDMEPPGSVAPAASDQPGQHAEQPHGLVESSFRDFAASGSPVSSRDANARKQSPFADLAASRNYAAPAHKASAAAPRLPSFLDQENMPIPIIPKSVATDAVYLLDKGPLKPFPRPHSVVEPAAHHRAMAGSPERKVLAVKSQNTPHRPAPPPPPPKMSVVETATKPAGAATTAQGAKKRTLLLKVNNVPYTRIDCLGRGGSGKVYKVAAENGKMYALKRVSLEHADENIVKGIKGEIDLLKQLADVERVIRLVDFELNVEKQILSLVGANNPSVW
jgi:serine/threonine-protein kinase TTK/MPS1